MAMSSSLARPWISEGHSLRMRLDLRPRQKGQRRLWPDAAAAPHTPSPMAGLHRSPACAENRGQVSPPPRAPRDPRSGAAAAPRAAIIVAESRRRRIHPERGCRCRRPWQCSRSRRLVFIRGGEERRSRHHDGDLEERDRYGEGRGRCFFFSENTTAWKIQPHDRMRGARW